MNSFNNQIELDLRGATRRQIAWAVAVFVVPFQLQYNYAINAFYTFGASYRDAGWFARLLWRNNWQLINPHDAASYLAVHFTPAFIPLTYLSHLLPTHPVEFYAALVATTYAGLAVAMLYALCTCIKPTAHGHFALLALIAVGFSFTGIVVQGTQLLHYEYGIPAGIIAFLVSLASGRLVLATVFLLITLSIREDAGFHAAAILGLIAIIKVAQHRSLSPIKAEASYFLLACAYSAITLWLTFHLRVEYKIPGGAFTIIYSGDPPYAHLSWPLLSERLHSIFAGGLHCWAPALVTLAWALRTRDPFLAVGFLATIPWFVLNWTAVWKGAGVLYSYYAFPFAVGIAWPVIAALFRHGTAVPPKVVRNTLKLQTLLVIIGLFTWNESSGALAFGPTYLARWGSYRLQPETEAREQVREFDRRLRARPDELGTILADGAVMSLVTDPARQIIEMGTEVKVPIDTVAYFRNFAPHHQQVLAECETGNCNTTIASSRRRYASSPTDRPKLWLVSHLS